MSRTQLLASMSSKELTDRMALWQLKHEEQEQAREEAKRNR